MPKLLLTLFFSIGLLQIVQAKTKPIRCQELVRQLITQPAPIQDAQQLKFKNVGMRDVYNPTAPFEIAINGNNTTVMAARVEPTHSENAKVMFFQKSGALWAPISGAAVFDLQDPFVTKIGKETVFGGVKTFPKPEGGIGYKTVFYRTKDLMTLKADQKPDAEGPPGMKDIRLLSLPNGKILVATRPQGNENGPGRIGFTSISRFEDLSPEIILGAKVATGLFPPDEWGGVNEMHILKDGRVGVLGHIARFGEKIVDGQKPRHYYPMTFAYDPKTGTHTAPKILLQRSDFDRFGLPQDAKRTDLKDVLFSGGLIRNSDGSAVLFVGAGDARVVRAELEKDPFLEYESQSNR